MLMVLSPQPAASLLPAVNIRIKFNKTLAALWRIRTAIARGKRQGGAVRRRRKEGCTFATRFPVPRRLLGGGGLRLGAAGTSGWAARGMAEQTMGRGAFILFEGLDRSGVFPAWPPTIGWRVPTVLWGRG